MSLYVRKVAESLSRAITSCVWRIYWLLLFTEEETHPIDLSTLANKLIPGLTSLGFKDDRRHKGNLNMSMNVICKVLGHSTVSKMLEESIMKSWMATTSLNFEQTWTLNFWFQWRSWAARTTLRPFRTTRSIPTCFQRRWTCCARLTETRPGSSVLSGVTIKPVDQHYQAAALDSVWWDFCVCLLQSAGVCQRLWEFYQKACGWFAG